MSDLFIEVLLELDAEALARQPNPGRYAMELARDAADRRCDDVGAQLRTDTPPGMIVDKATDQLTGREVVLMSTRWAVIAPDGLRPDALAGG